MPEDPHGTPSGNNLNMSNPRQLESRGALWRVARSELILNRSDALRPDIHLRRSAMVGCVIAHGLQQFQTAQRSLTAAVRLRKLRRRQFRNFFDGAIERFPHKRDHIFFAHGGWLPWTRVLPGERRQVLVERLRQMDHLLRKAHLRRSEFESVSWLRHLI